MLHGFPIPNHPIEASMIGRPGGVAGLDKNGLLGCLTKIVDNTLGADSSQIDLLTGSCSFIQLIGEVYKSAGGSYMQLKLNGDTAADYTIQAEVLSGGATSYYQTSAANIFVLDNLNVAGTQKHVYVISIYGCKNSELKSVKYEFWASNGQYMFGYGTWNNTADLSKISIIPATGVFQANSRFILLAG